MKIESIFQFITAVWIKQLCWLVWPS